MSKDGTRDRWGSRTSFVLAAIGSAIGLGNIWRFPFICHKYGAGAFLVAYFFALFTAGIPLLVLEMGLGNMMQGGAPKSFASIRKNLEWVGWWAALIGFVIVTYYTVIIGWTINYLLYSINLAWGDDPKTFFFNDFLGLTKGHFELGGIKGYIFLTMIITWIFIILSLWKGAKTAGKVVYFTVICPWLLLIVFVVRGLTLPGALAGINYYLTPNFKALLNYEVWLAAYAQVFFSLSVGFAIMIAYASFTSKKTDIVNNAFIIGLSDAATAFVGGFAVFGTLGYYAYETGKPVAEVMASGPGLAFVTYPTIISMLPLAPLFGVLFFLMLFTLGIDSAFSLVEAVATAVRDKWGIGHKKANITVAVICILAGILFTTGAGLLWLDVVDHFINQFGLCVMCLVECIIVGYYFGTKKLREYLNGISEIKLGAWWDFCIKVINPVVLGFLIIISFVGLIRKPYGGYEQSAIFLGGWLVIILLPVIGYGIMKYDRIFEWIRLHILPLIIAVILVAAVAFLLSRTGMNGSAIAMNIISLLLMFGGLTLCFSHISSRQE